MQEIKRLFREAQNPVMVRNLTGSGQWAEHDDEAAYDENVRIGSKDNQYELQIQKHVAGVCIFHISLLTNDLVKDNSD